MRSLYSTYPRGWPALGLLLLRAVVGMAVVGQGWRAFHAANPPSAWAAVALAIGVGVAVAIGLFTTVAAVLLGTGALGVALGWIPWSWTGSFDGHETMIFACICMAIALLGPGAVSVDARLRGRREIVIPRDAPNRRRSK